MPKVSVIIPTYNCSKYVTKAIDSVLAQTYKDYEIIVVDDGSTDDTCEVLNPYMDRIHYIYQENAGVSASRNAGIQAAAGKWIAFLDSDDLWKAHHLAGIVSILRKTGVCWACGQCEEIVEGSDRRASRSYWQALLKDGCLFDNFFEAWPRRGAPFNTDGMVIRRDVIEEVGGFSTAFHIGEDLDLWFSIAHRHPQIGLLQPASVVYVRRNGSLMDVHGANSKIWSQIWFQLLSRHMRLASSLGKEASTRFNPTARHLASWILNRDSHEEDKGPLRELILHYPQLLGPSRMTARLILRFPRTVVLRDSYIWLGVKTKATVRILAKAFRRLRHIPSHACARSTRDW